MKHIMQCVVAVCLVSCAVAQGQTELVSIEDGVIVLNGTYKNLAGIEARSDGGYLSLNQIQVAPDLTLDDKSPFSFNVGTVVSNTPNSVVIGVLGEDRRIDIEGRTPTGILYSESSAVARTDLSVALGLGDGTPVGCSPPICPEPASHSMLLFGLLGMAACRRCRPLCRADSNRAVR